MRIGIASLLIFVLVTGCSDQVDVADGPEPLGGAVASGPGAVPSADDPSTLTVSADGAMNDVAAAIAINSAANTIDEPSALAWTAARQGRRASCSSGPAQTAAEAFATSGFSRVDDANGQYLVTDARSNDGPSYIEFCITVPERARYRFAVVTRALGVFEDSFFVTVDEDEPDTVPEPGIWDVSRTTGFTTTTLRTRTDNPLTPTLTAGEHVFRLYAREQNTAIRRIEAVRVGDVPTVEPPAGDELAQCAANTGYSVAQLDTWITDALGNVTRRFVLSPFEQDGTELSPRFDYKWTSDDGRANVMCLSAPPAGSTNLVDNSIAADRIVFGSTGTDLLRAATPLRGTFFGNGGNDRIGTLDGGRFVGGDGDDRVETSQSGTFVGGAGNDVLGTLRDGRFEAGDGDDRVDRAFAGTFDGGAGRDRIDATTSSVTLIDVEEQSDSFEPLTAPIGVRLTALTPSSAVVRWDAVNDPRVTGYAVVVDIDESGQRVIDRQSDPSFLGGETTIGTAAEVRFNNLEFARRISVFAYSTGTADFEFDATLYSPATETRIEPNDLAPLQRADEIVADTLLPAGPYDTAVLTSSGPVIVANARAPSNAGTPVFVRFDERLGDPTPVTPEELVDRNFEVFSGNGSQFVYRRGFNEGPDTLSFFLGDDLFRVWQVDVPRDPSRPFSTDCGAPRRTPDGWFYCVGAEGNVQAFGQDATLYTLPDGTLELGGQLVTGTTESVVVIGENDEGSALATARTIRLPTGPAGTVTVRPAALPAETVFEPRLATVIDTATGQDVVIAGRSAGNCFLPECNGTPPDDGFFLVRASLADGSVSAFVTGPLESDPIRGAGTGFMTVVDDDLIIGRDGGYSVYRADTLEETSSGRVRGRAIDAEGGVILSEEALGEALPSSFLVRDYRLALTPY